MSNFAVVRIPDGKTRGPADARNIPPVQADRITCLGILVENGEFQAGGAGIQDQICLGHGREVFL